MCQSGWRFANKMQSDKKNAQNLTSPNLCKNLTLNNKPTSGASNFQLLLWFPLPRVFNDDSSFSLTSRLKSKPKIQNRLYGHICLHCNICSKLCVLKFYTGTHSATNPLTTGVRISLPESNLLCSN